MSILLNSAKTIQKIPVFRNLLLKQIVIRNLAGWNKDFKPGPYPTTEKERLEAAKKYNLLPEDYQPHDDDGFGYGDYPKWDIGLGAEARDPFYPYDYPESKRNYGHNIHVDEDMFGEDRCSFPEEPRFKTSSMTMAFASVIGASVLVFCIMNNYKTFPPIAAKQFPKDGVKHYTFEME